MAHLLLAVLLGFAGLAMAGDLRVAPTRLNFSPTDRVQELIVANPSAQLILVEIDALDWSQNAAGRQLHPSDALLVTPPIVQIPAHDEVIVRVGFRQPEAPSCEQSFRLWVTEVPTQQGAGGPVQLRSRMSLPVFRRGQMECPPRLQWQATAEQLRLYNTGGQHLRVQEIELNWDQRQYPLRVQGLGYLLPGGTLAVARPSELRGANLLAASLVVRSPTGEFKLPYE